MGSAASRGGGLPLESPALSPQWHGEGSPLWVKSESFLIPGEEKERLRCILKVANSIVLGDLKTATSNQKR